MKFKKTQREEKIFQPKIQNAIKSQAAKYEWNMKCWTQNLEHIFTPWIQFFILNSLLKLSKLLIAFLKNTYTICELHWNDVIKGQFLYFVVFMTFNLSPCCTFKLSPCGREIYHVRYATSYAMNPSLTNHRKSKLDWTVQVA